ncbi:MAG: glycoside hydrolase family 15 protein [Nanobdellota archaeon]
MTNSKINQLLDSSKSVIQDCIIENGSIVAANSKKKYYPREAKNYFFVWPRDASFTCIAGDIIGFRDFQEKFFNWLTTTQKFQETGLFYEKYFTNGKLARSRFQPDQVGTVLFASWYHFKYKGNINRNLVKKCADGICATWDKNNFTISTNDLWEERLTFPDLKDNFSYSLSACIKGLECAYELTGNNRYKETMKSIKKKLIDSAKNEGNFFRAFGKINDKRIDASLLGLIWPFDIIKPGTENAKKTIEKIESNLVKDYGVYRYEHDEYDGWIYNNQDRKKGAGYWPLLNFWMSIVLHKMGKRDEALKYYFKVINDVDNTFIAEQIFKNKIQVSVKPLCWSHCMFIIASKELGYL